MSSFQDYIEAAGEKRGIWRLLLGLLIIVIVWLVVQIAILGAWIGWRYMQLGDMKVALDGLAQLQKGGHPALIALVLSTFIGIWPGTFIAAKVLHLQSFGTLFAPRPGGAMRGFLKGLALALVFAGASTLAGTLITQPVRSDVGLGTWAVWLLPILALVFLQAIGEELIFRAYLLQQLARIARSPIVWAVLPSLFFGLAHLANAPIEGGALYYVAVTTISGVALAVLVWRAGSLWPAAGLHFGINITAITIVGGEGLLSGMQIWTVPEADFLPLIRIDAAASILLLLFVISPLGRIFGNGKGGA